MSQEAMRLACKALRDCHYYMINAGLPNQSLLNEAFTAYMELEAALAKQPAPASVGSLESLKLSMQNSAWEGVIQLSDALKNIDDFAAEQPAQQEPVAWQYRDSNDDGTWGAWLGCDKRLAEDEYRQVRALYASPQPAPVQQEPVAVVSGYYGGQCVILPIDPARIFNSNTALYTSPPQRKPMTHEQRVDLLAKFEAHKHEWHAPSILIDMVEAAQGIGEKK